MRRMLALLCAAVLLAAPAAALCGAAVPTGGGAPSGYVALTFDDGPSGQVTEDLLAELERRGAACTFFICGYRMEDFPTDLTAYAAHGHELGVHGWSHQYLRHLDEAALTVELDDTALMIEELSGIRPRWFRPPGGLYDQTVCDTAARLDLAIALWSVDPEDWNHRTQAQIVDTILSQTGDGDVVLLHDIFPASRAAALELVDALQARGYALVTLSQLAAAKGSAADPGAVYSCFG